MRRGRREAASPFLVHRSGCEGRLRFDVDLGSAVSPRVLVARRAMTAEARMKMLPTSNARWKPDVRACAAGIPAASRWFVRLVDTAVKIARPSAPPSHCDALSRAAASPALSAG